MTITEVAVGAPSDAELIARARVEPAAFGAVFDRHYEAIHAYLRRRLDAPIAEELAAETFVRALRGVKRYDDDRADALPWLYGEVFVEIADALREAPQPPRLRATLFRALALVPGVQLLGELRDRLGREAIGVAFTEPNGLRQELLFDPETSEILNERQVVVHPVPGLRAAPGTVVEDIVYTRRAVTDATERP